MYGAPIQQQPYPGMQQQPQQQQYGMDQQQQQYPLAITQQPGPNIAVIQLAPQSLDALAPYHEVTVTGFKDAMGYASGMKNYRVTSNEGMVRPLSKCWKLTDRS